MPNLDCAVINCSSSTYKLKKWKQETCYNHKDLAVTRRLHSLCIIIQIILFSEHTEKCRIKKQID